MFVPQILIERPMARVYFELSEFAPLVHEVANRRRPLLSRTIGKGPWPVHVQLDVTLHALESIESDGPITVESTFQPGEALIPFKANVPKINLKIQSTLKRGTSLIKDGDWPVEVNFECTITGKLHLTGGAGDEPALIPPKHHVQVEFKDFQLRCPAFPIWMERPIQAILERTLESMIVEMIPVELRRPFTSSARETSANPARAISTMQVASLVQQETSLTNAQPALKKGAFYWSAFYLGYGLTFPAAWISAAFLRNTVVEAGLQDGAHSAANAADRLTKRWSARIVETPIGEDHLSIASVSAMAASA
jgi:hypothetical protein